ncbi:HD domain-containing protein [Nocardia sp. NPDC051981]|uniref:HD domain-containing protein n=1 Tax=Nocardia sp. NPDC051981 TaxID=3155417 RepID=UPI00343E08BE
MDAALMELLAPLTDSRRAHTIAVGRKVASIAGAIPGHLRDETVTAACLHDVGYGYPVLGFHPIDGAQLLAARGYSRIACHLVAFHSASRIEAEVRGISPDVFDPFVLEEISGIDVASDFVWWADMSTGPTGDPVTIDQRLADIRVRYPDGSIVRTAIDRAEPLLRAAVQRVSALLGE